MGARILSDELCALDPEIRFDRKIATVTAHAIGVGTFDARVLMRVLAATAPRFELPGHFGYKQDTRLQAGTFHPWVSGVGFAP
jgi:hypothetical protein